MLVRGRYPHRARLQGNTYQSPRFENVLHLLRCPMQHISSFTSHLNASYDFVQTHMLQQINSLSSVPSNSVARSAQHQSIQNNILNSNSMPCSREASIWCSRNYTDFFFRRKSIIMEPENRWPRGSKHWLHFSALSWLFWNSHIQR